MRLSEKELQVIKEAMDAEKNARVYKRYLSLYLYQSGKKCREIMEIVGFSKPLENSLPLSVLYRIRYSTDYTEKNTIPKNCLMPGI